jgi:hypothetical protein
MTKGRLWVPVLVALLVLVLVTGSSPLVAGAGNSAPAPGEDLTARITGASFMTAHGTAWVPELRGRFAKWRPVGWGMQAKVRAAGVGDQWVHIPMPMAPWLDDTTTWVFYVTFCAQSSNGARTKPIQIDVWSGSTRIYTSPVNWEATNARRCANFEISRTLVTSVGISVLLHFATTTDEITLEEASVSFAP